jgi:hypothetical protein
VKLRPMQFTAQAGKTKKKGRRHDPSRYDKKKHPERGPDVNNYAWRQSRQRIFMGLLGGARGNRATVTRHEKMKNKARAHKTRRRQRVRIPCQRRGDRSL